MRPTYTQDQIEERYQKLPDALKQALFAPDVAEKMFAIGKKYGLTIEKIGLAADEVGAVILGFTKPNNFVGYFADALGIESAKAGEIASDINHEILYPLREELKKTHEVDFNIDTLRPAFMTPPRGPISPPTTGVKPPLIIMPKNFPAAAPSTGVPSPTFTQKSSLLGSATPTPLSPSLTRPIPPYPPSKSGTTPPPAPEEKNTAPLSSKPTEEESLLPPRIISPSLDKKSSISDAFKKSSWIMPQKTPESEKKPVSSSPPAPVPEDKKQMPPPMVNRTPTEISQSSTAIPDTSPQSQKTTIPIPSVSSPPLEKKTPSLPRYTPPATPKPIDLRNFASPPLPSSSPSSLPTSKPVSPLMSAVPPKSVTVTNEEIHTKPEITPSSIPTPAIPKESVTTEKEHAAKQLSRNENDPYREPME